MLETIDFTRFLTVLIEKTDLKGDSLQGLFLLFFLYFFIHRHSFAGITDFVKNTLSAFV